MTQRPLPLLFGAALGLLGIGGYVLTGAASATALIPAFFGAAVIALALAGRRFRWLGIVLLGVVVLGMLGSFPGVLRIGTLFDGTADRPAAVISQATMFLLSATFLALTFARRPGRGAQSSQPPGS